MSPILIAVLCGGGVGIGVMLIVAAFTTDTTTRIRLVSWPRLRNIAWWRLGACVAAGVVAGWVTGWPVAGGVAAALAWIAPAFLGPDTDHHTHVTKVEAIAAWTESVRDALTGAAGLEQAILAASQHAPEAIARPATRLADAITTGQSTSDALARFAADIGDETCDLVVAALIHAIRRHATGIAPLLGTLADTARSHVAMRARVAASRARLRTATRVITITVIVMAAGLIALSRDFLAPYDSLEGQIVLLLVAGLFAFGLWWLRRLAAAPPPVRLLATATSPEPREELS